MYEKILGSCFDVLCMPKLSAWLTESAIRSLWYSTLVETSKIIPVAPKDTLRSIAKKNGMLRLQNRLMCANPTPYDIDLFCITLAYELIEQGRNIPPGELIQFSNHFSREYLNSLSKEKVTRDYLDQRCGLKITDLLKKSLSVSPACALSLHNNDNIRKSYFESYNTPGAPDEVLIWLPGSDGVTVNYELKHANIYKVCINCVRGVEVGFFKRGVEYSKTTDLEKSKLNKVLYCKKRRLESGAFTNDTQISFEGKCIWNR